MGITTSTIMKSEWDYFRCHIEAKMPRNDEDCARHHRPRERRTDRRMDKWMDGGTDRQTDGYTDKVITLIMLTEAAVKWKMIWM